MEKAYLDNASTTALRPEVIAEMTRVLSENYGNPSSTHAFGRAARVVLETSRKTIARCINAEAREIIFTSGGTEADNWILNSAVKDLKVKRIISSRIEHHAVLNTLLVLQERYEVTVDYVNLLPNGDCDLNHLEELLMQDIPTLVSLMHVNNETGNVLDLVAVGNVCRNYKAWFHSDMVQSVGKTELDFKNLPIDFAVASAHKFHGPKGIGFAFVRKESGLQPLIYGGEQEKGLRAGTEAVHQVAGMAKALEVNLQHLEEERSYIKGLKVYLLTQLSKHFPGFKVNGAIAVTDSSLFYNIANVMLPLPEDKTTIILFHLDMHGVAVSRGSACQSGSSRPSHVLKEILSHDDVNKPSLRVSFSHYNTNEDVDRLIAALKTLK